MKQDLANSRVFWLFTWTVLNIILTMTNKNFYYYMDFPYPIAVSLVHMACSSSLSFFTIKMQRTPMRTLNTGEHLSLAALSLLFVTNILVGNLCLKYTSVLLVQVTRSIVPGLTLVLSVWIMNATFTKFQVLSILMIVIGLGLTSFGDVSVTAFGLGLNVLGCVFAALKGVMTSKFLKGFEPMELLFRLSTYAVFHLVVLMAIMGETSKVKDYFAERGTLNVCAVFLANGFIAFFVNVCNVQTTKLTSALTISIAGNVKQVLTVGLGILVFNDYLSLVNGGGVLVTFIGVFVYTWACHKKKMAPQSEKIHTEEHLKTPLSISLEMKI